MFQLRRLVLLATASLALGACLSPTLPLPPPDRPDVSSPDASGMVRIQGLAPVGSTVTAWNHANNLTAGQVLKTDPKYDFTLRADVGDLIELYYTKSTDQSQSVEVTVPAAK